MVTILTASAVAIAAVDATRAETGTDPVMVHGTVVDIRTGAMLPARLHIQSEDGTWHFVESNGGSAVHYDRRRPTRPGDEVHTTLSADPFLAKLPVGRYRIRAERGKEYFPVTKTVEVSGDSYDLRIALDRWINMSQRHWYSGDTHVHRKLSELPNAMLAEDLNVALPLNYWVTESDQPPDAAVDQIKPELIAVDPTHVIYPVNTEYEIFRVGRRSHTLGAVFVLNHQSAFPIGVPPVKPVARLARAQGALLDLDKHNWPWSMMIVPIMNVDLFELSNNHLWQTEFGFRQWYAEMVPDFMQIERDAQGLTEHGWAHFGFQTYYALLNCGFRLRVSAGTASGVHPVQIGFGRVYVYLPDGFSYRRWIAALDAGRSFVTTGPMLEVTFNDRPPGETFQAEASDSFTVTVNGVASSQRPLDRIEIVVNGDVSQTIDAENARLESGAYVSRFRAVISKERSFWVAVRCFESHPQRRLRFAHTNPVFVDIANRPSHPKKEQIEYFVRRMTEEIARNRPVLSPAALAEYEEALNIYERIAESAK